jgi:hypothetical protein
MSVPQEHTVVRLMQRPVGDVVPGECSCPHVNSIGTTFRRLIKMLIAQIGMDHCMHCMLCDVVVCIGALPYMSRHDSRPLHAFVQGCKLQLRCTK